MYIVPQRQTSNMVLIFKTCTCAREFPVDVRTRSNESKAFTERIC